MAESERVDWPKGRETDVEMQQPMPTDKPKTTARYRVDDLLVDVGRAQVTRAGSEVPLPKLSFDLFLALIETAPSIATADELVTRVWPGLVVSPETVSQRAKLLREALGDDSRQPRYLAVVRGRGYRLVAEVVRLDTLPPPAATAGIGATAPATAITTQSYRWRWIAAGVGATLLTAVAVGYWRPLLQSRSADTPAAMALSTATGSTSVIAKSPGTVAVLPFANLTGDATKDYLGEGMSDELINSLTKVQGLKVPARTSSFAYEGRNTDIRQIAKDLGVATILEGSVRTAGERIRITAQLVNAQDGLHIWSESYDRKFTDLFKLQDELATEIVKALRVNLNGAPPESVAQAPPTKDVEAYNLYLQGASLARRPTEANLNRAIMCFEEALKRDPNFARAQQGVADAKFVFVVFLKRRPFENAAAAERAAQRALALDPKLADAHDVLGGVASARGQWLQMAAHDRAALTLGDNDGQIHMVRGGHLTLVGHLHEALEEGRKGYMLAPADPLIIASLAYYYSSVGQDAEALKYADLAIDFAYTKDNAPLPAIYERAARRFGHYADAAEIRIKTLDATVPDEARTGEVVRLVYAALANPRRKVDAIAARTRLYPKLNAAAKADPTVTNAIPCLDSSYMYVLLGELDIAYDLANQCLDSLAPAAVLGTAIGSELLWSPEVHPFRLDRRFQAFVTRLGLMEYWQQYGPPDDCDLKDRKLTCR